MLKHTPPTPSQTPVFGTNPRTTQWLSISIQQLREKYEEKEIKPFEWKKAEENISIYLSYFLSDFLVCYSTLKHWQNILKSHDFTLNTMCNIIWRPAFPGYFPVILAAVKSNMFAPVSVQTQCTSIFFPTPRGPAIRTDLTNGDFSCTAWDPTRQITEKDRNVKIQPIS